MTFLGYERPNGLFGVRNYVAVISVMENVNAIVRAIVDAVDGTIAIPTLFVRGQLGNDYEITMASLAGLASNPNVAGVVVIGLEPVTTEELVERIRPSGKPVEAVSIQLVGGSIEAIALGTRHAARMVRAASRQFRVEAPISELILGVECGGSDTTSGLASNPAIGVVADRIVSSGGKVVISETSEFLGAEQEFAKRAVAPEIGRQFVAAVEDLERTIMSQGIDLRGSNPSKDNIRGGLTTIEEKAYGAMAKAGTTPLVGVLGYGEVAKAPGLHFMATPAPAVESLTALAAGGCQLILFSTGVGNPIGSMVSTTIKVTGNRKTAHSMADNIDFDVSAILEEGEAIEAAGVRLYDYSVNVANGEMTTSEILNNRETSISRFGLSM